MELMENFLRNEPEEDKEVTELADEIREGLIKCFTDSLEDDDSDNNIYNVLLDDDHLLEDLVDKLSYLNILEAASGGSLQKDSREKPPGEVTKEEIEEAYLSVLDNLFELSKTVNPLSGVGRDRLETGLSIIREFEKLYWPISTRVTEENISSFEEFLPEDQLQDVTAGTKHAIGALRHMGDEVYAAGVIVYSLPSVSSDGTQEIILDWIMVREELTEMGISNFLMAKLLGLALQNEGTGIRVTLPVEMYDDEDEMEKAAVLYQFLDEWGFGFNVSTGDSFVIRLSELEGNMFIDQPGNMAEPLSRLGSKGPVILDRFLRELKDPNRTDLVDLPYTFFDRDLSCMIRKDGELQSVLILHSYPGGNVRYEGLVSSGKTDPTDVMDLVGSAFSARKTRGNMDAMVYGDFISEEGVKTAAKLMPDARCPMRYVGMLIPDENAFTTREWDELRRKVGLRSNMIPDDGIGEE